MTWTHRTELYRDYLEHGAYSFEWAHGGGYRRSVGIWRLRGRIVWLAEAADC